MEKITTALYDEKNLTGEYFYQSLSFLNRVNTVFRATNEITLFENLQHIIPDVLFMHIRPDRKAHRQLIRKLKKEFPYVRVLLLLINYEPIPEEVFNLVSAGANGVITDSYGHDDVLKAMEEVLLKGNHCNSICSRELFEKGNRKDFFTGNNLSLRGFTERELRIITLKKEGKTSAEVGEILHISDRTVNNILMRLYERFDCHGILELIGHYEHLTLKLVS